MWTCPKCGREFKRTNQGHYCGKAPENIDEYIEAQAAEARAHIEGLRNIIHSCVPTVKEKIAWSMPYFEKDTRSVSLAACKNHISLYLDAESLDAIKEQVSGFAIKKNALYLPYNKELPAKAIETAVNMVFAVPKADYAAQDVLLFFDKSPKAVPLHEVLEGKLFSMFPETKMRVQKTQITFSKRHVYACVSLQRVKKKAELPDPYIVLTLGLPYPLDSDRVAVKTEPYPGRWTTHIVIGSVEEIDDELLSWAREAYEFAQNK